MITMPTPSNAFISKARASQIVREETANFIIGSMQMVTVPPPPKPKFLPSKATHYANRALTIVDKLSDIRDGLVKDKGDEVPELMVACDDAQAKVQALYDLLYSMSSLNNKEGK